MMTARLQLINALKQKKRHKLQRIVEVLQAHPDSPWAMAPKLLEKLQAACVANTATTESQDLSLKEMAHA